MKTLFQLILKCILAFSMFAALLVSLSDEHKAKMKYEMLAFLFKANAETQTASIEVQSAETLQSKSLRIYLYNTHQSEEYIDGITIFEVTEILAQLLESAGFEVVFERADFLEELQKQNKKYNQLYSISRMHLQEALIHDGPFDLIIDVHRDSASRIVSVLDHEGVSYARLMFVIGEKSINANHVRTASISFSDKMNQRLSGIMREPFSRQSEYNQGVADNMLLLEVGSDQNTSSEAIRSLRVLVEMLKEEGWS